MFCPNCGSKMADGALFCGNCGNKLAAPEMPVQETPAPVYEAPVQEPVYEAPVQQPVYEAPVQEPVYEAPVQQPVYEAPVQQPVYEAPVQQPVYEAPVQQPVYEAPVQQPVYEAPVQQPVYEAPVQQPVYQQPVYQPPVTPAPVKQKKKKSLGWLWAILIVLILGAGAVLALDYFDVIDLGIFGDQYAVVKEAVTYNADDEETSYMSVEVNKKGLPETITIEAEGNDRTIEIEYKKDNTISSITTIWENGNEHYEEYDKHGNVIYAEDGSTEYEYEYTYDKKGNVTEEVCYVDGDESYSIIREFDKHDNVTYYEYNDNEHTEYSYARVYEYTYDKKGNITEEVCYDYDTDEEQYTETYKYDSKGNVVSSEYTSGDYVTYYEYEYNKKGKITYIGAYDEDDNEVYACEYKYNKNGNKTAEYIYSDGELESYTEYSWFNKSLKLSDAQIEALFGLDAIAKQ